MKKTSPLLLSIRDTSLGVLVSTATLEFVWIYQEPQRISHLRFVGIILLLVAVVMILTALPISYLARKLPLSGSSATCSMKLCSAGTILGPIIVFLCTTWFPGADSIFSERLLPFTLAAAAAGAVTGGLTGYTFHKTQSLRPRAPRPFTPKLGWKPSLGYRPHLEAVQQRASRPRINP